MFSTEQQSSSLRKDKAPAERLSPLQEMESENAGLRRQVRESQLEIDEIRTRKEDLEADQVAKNLVIERLSNDLSRWELKFESCKKHNAQLQEHNHRLQAFLHDLFQKQYEELQAYHDRYRASNDKYQSELTDAQKLMNNESDPVPLTASETAETKERANPQYEQSASNNHAEELVPRKTSKDTTEEDLNTVEVEKNTLAEGSGSKATILKRSLSKTNTFQALDEDKAGRKKRKPNRAEVPSQNPADKRYVVRSPARVKSNEQSRAGLTISTPWPISYLAPDTSFATLTGTGGWGSGDRYGFKTLPSKHSSVVQERSAPQAPDLPSSPWNSPQPKDVRSWASPLRADSVNDYAQKAATSAHPNSGEKPDLFDILMEKHKKRFGVEVDVEKELAKIRQRRAAESSKPSPDQTRGVDSSSNSKSGKEKATTHGDSLLQSIDKDLESGHNAFWSEGSDKDGGVEVTGRPKESAVVSSSREKGVTSIHQPAKAPAPQTSEHVGKESQPRSQGAEIGPDNKTFPTNAKEQEIHGGTDRLPLGPKGPSIPPGHVHKPKSETEGAYTPGSNSTRRKRRDKNRGGKVIFRVRAGETGDNGSKGDLSGSRKHR